jgi:dienelactone hydrolase
MDIEISARAELRMLEHMKRRFDRAGRRLAFRARTRQEWGRWRAALRRRLKELTGYATMQKAPLKARVTERVSVGEFVRERVEIQTEPGVVMPLYAIRLAEAQAPLPAVICPHGHGSGGKLSPAGVRDIPEVAAAVEQYNYDYGLQFARAGFITFCPDARGFGERREPDVPLMSSSCQWINQMAYPLGQTVTGMWAWDLSRLIDYIETRTDCRPGLVGCAGLSGGGLQTLWASALDDRVRCAVVSGYFYGYRESLLVLHRNCSCNYVPRLYEYADIGDVGALIAPRPLLIETGDRDPLNGPSGVANVRSQVAILRRAYRLLGAGKALKHDVFEGEHRWHGAEAIPWMKRWLAR